MKLASWYLAVFLGLACLGNANAANVVWPAAFLSGGMGLADYALGNLEPEEYAGQSILFNLNVINILKAQLTGETATAGAGQFWFRTTFGAPIDAGTIDVATPFVDSYNWIFGEITVIRNTVFYLGYETVGTYGWASLKWDGTNLILLDSAAETTGVGIYAGTYTAIPEPSTAGLILAGLSALVFKRNRRSEAIDNCQKSPYVLVKHRS